jgi:NhaA family Na+:H+ antiporter
LTSPETQRERGSEGRAGLPPPWSRSERRLPRLVVRPLQRFLNTEASSGFLLLGATALALVWANSPWDNSYERVWHTELTIRLGPLQLSEDLRHFINEALMAIFFFVVGLEIKRELVAGELRDPRTAALPAFGALGGMIVPALLYLLANPGGDASRGWGIPMATDIAFALGVLAIAGKGLPASLKLFLLSLAIVDDIGAILVIALFYSQEISGQSLGVAAGLLVLILVLQRAHVRATPIYVLLGTGVWLAVFQSGVHATVAGVALGLLTPAVPFYASKGVSEEAREVANRTPEDPTPSDADAAEWLSLAEVAREAVSPLTRLEHLLHPWTSFVIVPLFALANAGVELGREALTRSFASRITLGIALGLVVGKVAGISLATWLGTRLGLARIPHGVRWSQLIAVGAVAGVGFTVSLFIANLAFDEAAPLEAAKVGVLAASLMAGVMGSMLLFIARRFGHEKSLAGDDG